MFMFDEFPQWYLSKCLFVMTMIAAHFHTRVRWFSSMALLRLHVVMTMICDWVSIAVVQNIFVSHLRARNFLYCWRLGIELSNLAIKLLMLVCLWVWPWNLNWVSIVLVIEHFSLSILHLSSPVSWSINHCGTFKVGFLILNAGLFGSEMWDWRQEDFSLQNDSELGMPLIVFVSLMYSKVFVS